MKQEIKKALIITTNDDKLRAIRAEENGVIAQIKEREAFLKKQFKDLQIFVEQQGDIIRAKYADRLEELELIQDDKADFEVEDDVIYLYEQRARNPLEDFLLKMFSGPIQ